LFDFDRDHVIPRSFGTFKNNLTLIETVCRSCNQDFGKELELFLSRNTLEGMLRYKYGVKAPEDFNFLNESRVILKLKENGAWKGSIMQLKYSNEQKEIVVEPVNQVGFQKRDTREWDFFEVKDIKSEDDLQKQGYITKGERCLKVLFGPEFKEGKGIQRQLERKGIRVTIDNEEPLPFNYRGSEVKIEILGTIDKIIFRGVAKIAFNYLAYILGREFALNSNFKGIRNFIKHGETNGFSYVLIQKTPILQNEKRFGVKETRGHLITLGWDGYRFGIISQVTLFNTIIYRVILCKRFSGLYREIASGHHFDIESREVSRLHSLPKDFYVP